MTTVDTTSPIPADWVERVEERASQSTVDARRVVLAILFLIPMVLGMGCALIVRAAVFAVAAFREGYTVARTHPLGAKRVRE